MCVRTRPGVSSCLFAGVFISAGTGGGTDGGQFDQRLRGESGREERGDSDGGREQGRVTGNPSEALLSLFNYHPSLALLITPTRTHTHVRAHRLHAPVYAHAVGSCIGSDPLTQGGFVQCGR